MNCTTKSTNYFPGATGLPDHAHIRKLTSLPSSCIKFSVAFRTFHNAIPTSLPCLVTDFLSHTVLQSGHTHLCLCTQLFLDFPFERILPHVSTHLGLTTFFCSPCPGFWKAKWRLILCASQSHTDTSRKTEITKRKFSQNKDPGTLCWLTFVSGTQARIQELEISTQKMHPSNWPIVVVF